MPNHPLVPRNSNKKTALFRRLVNDPEIHLLPVAHDVLSAFAITQAELSAMSIGEYGTVGSVLR